MTDPISDVKPIRIPRYRSATYSNERLPRRFPVHFLRYRALFWSSLLRRLPIESNRVPPISRVTQRGPRFMDSDLRRHKVADRAARLIARESRGRSHIALNRRSRRRGRGRLAFCRSCASPNGVAPRISPRALCTSRFAPCALRSALCLVLRISRWTPFIWRFALGVSHFAHCASRSASRLPRFAPRAQRFAPRTSR